MNYCRHSRLLGLVLAGAAQLLWIPAEAAPQAKTGKKPARSKPVDEQPQIGEQLSPAVFLVRDPLVHAALQLNGEQQTAALEIAAEFNEPIWKLRDVSAEDGAVRDEIRRINEAVESKLERLLSAAQRERLEQIVLRVQGLSAIAQPAVANRLDLTDRQREAIARLLSNSQQALAELRRGASTGKMPPDLDRRVDRLVTGMQTDILRTLGTAQTDRWKALLGKPIDLSKLQSLTAQAPELRAVEAWINSEPLTLAGLKGRVVVLHFWTFG